jgi:coenzyme Q-binding protein COQ10
MPPNARMITVDSRDVAAPVAAIFARARDVERWPEHLPHYRHVRFVERFTGGGGVVSMSATRPFGPIGWPASWTSEMQVVDRGDEGPYIRFRHIRGITRGMEVLWSFAERSRGTRVTILHMWNGPSWPVIGVFAARAVIGPVFVHGIASRTLEGLAGVAERASRAQTGSDG